MNYSEYINQEVDIFYTEYIDENLDKNISYSKYIASQVDKNIAYADYLSRYLTRINLDRKKKIKKIWN